MSSLHVRRRDTTPKCIKLRKSLPSTPLVPCPLSTMSDSSNKIQVIPIYTALSLETLYWTCAADVLRRLLDHPSERNEILREIRRRSKKHRPLFIIYHPLLVYDIVLDSNDSDVVFRNQLQRHFGTATRTSTCSPIMKAGF